MGITQWNLSHRATVYPHLELEQRAYSQEEMRDLAKKLKANLPELNIHIYDQSTFCNELNGPWNVCFAIGDPKTKMAYTYIIRRCVHFKKTYGCPFVNTAYIYDLKIAGLMKESNSRLFDIIENMLMKLVPNAKKVNYFDT
tara:strand:- start:179 stop:601 length:423 start_codon:yes stop_codon:yes gene_type:complete